MRVPVSTSRSSEEATKGPRGTSLRSCSIFAALPSNRQAHPSAPSPANSPGLSERAGNYRLSLIFLAEKADSTKIEPGVPCQLLSPPQNLAVVTFRPSDLQPPTPVVICVLNLSLAAGQILCTFRHRG